MREVISTVYELADLGVTIVPVKSQTGPVNTAMGRLLWAVQAWFGEMENEERSENVRLGQARARAQGKEIGRPKEVAGDMEQRNPRPTCQRPRLQNHRQPHWRATLNHSAHS